MTSDFRPVVKSVGVSVIRDGSDTVLLRTVSFHVSGIPAPQGSKRPVRLGNGRIGMVESSAKVEPWRAAVHAAAILAVREPFTGPVQVALRFTLPRPLAHYRRGKLCQQLRDDAPGYPGSFPDLDKLCRSTFDGLTVSKKDGRGAWADDGQVIRLTAVKQYAEPGITPGAVITITECASAGDDARIESRAAAPAAARAEPGEDKHPCSLPF